MRRTAPTHAIYLLTILTAATLLALATAGLAVWFIRRPFHHEEAPA